jgi:sugar phosphate isomerase/epimerase
MDLSRLSLNQITCDHNSLEELAAACQQQSIPWIAPWRHKIQETGVPRSAQIIRDAGLRVSSLCRGGYFPAATQAEREARLDDNRRAIDEAAVLGTDVLVLVCGPAPDRDIDAARRMVEDGIERLIPYAEQAGVKLGIEPLHPAFAADRSVVVSLGQANDLAERIGSKQVGVVIDVYHVWWDPEVYKEIDRAAGNVLGFHVNDWSTGGGDPFVSRTMMGDGVIEINRMRKAVEAAGYHGPIEVEIINEKIWSKPYRETLELTKTRFIEHV